jgi:23S rRNA (adenine2503-C2)-methyltransferase
MRLDSAASIRCSLSVSFFPGWLHHALQLLRDGKDERAKRFADVGDNGSIYSGARTTGAVFMGMGEPFLNYDRVLAAAELLSFPIEAAISAEAITISTVGLVPQIEKFTLENRRFRLSISLGAATDEKRKLLLPIASRTPVAEIMGAARRYAQSRHTRVMLSYVCIRGVNVSEDDARALGDLIRDTPVRLDLIDVEDQTGRYLPPAAVELNRFRDALRRYVGQPVVRRYSGGSDIGAACGALGSNQTPGSRQLQ